jgi:acetyl-CoA C-acetyltransferase
MTAAPVLIGWSQVTRHEGEPLEAWAVALRDTGVPAAAIDSLDVVYCQSWSYDDPPGRLAALVGASPKRKSYSGIGGTTPLSLLATAADRILAGEAEVCAIVGGEALATVRRLKKAGERPAWSHRDPEKKPFPFEAPFHPSEIAHQVFQAYTTFALRDVARRASRGESVAEHAASIGGLFAPMTEVAATNPHAWFPVVRSADELMGVTAANRVVAHPFTKLVTAIMDVDICGALVVASEEAADRLAVPADHRVRVRGWAEDRDPDYVAEHPDLWRAPGMTTALAGALGRAGAAVDDVEMFELYSCFPSSVSFSLDALGLSPDDSRGPFTVTGGLPYAGGPGSCYSIGATAAMASQLVERPDAVGLVSAVGMHLSKHAAVVLSTSPGEVGTPVEAAALGAARVDRRPIVDTVDGAATIAAYTVHHAPDGSATDGLLVCDVEGHSGGGRCYAKVTDPGLLVAMEADEFVGRRVTLRPDGGTNLAEAD